MLVGKKKIVLKLLKLYTNTIILVKVVGEKIVYVVVMEGDIKMIKPISHTEKPFNLAFWVNQLTQMKIRLNELQNTDHLTYDQTRERQELYSKIRSLEYLIIEKREMAEISGLVRTVDLY